MDRRIALLRGVNVGGRNRLPMAELRAALSSAGFAGARTHLQSGNVVVDGDDPPAEVARACARVIAERFDLRIPVVVRTRDELAEVVRRNPLAAVASDPKRYQVSFLDDDPAPEVVAGLMRAVAPPERCVVEGRHVYAWHPETIARSRLWAALAGPGLGVTATARNWATVGALLALAES